MRAGGMAGRFTAVYKKRGKRFIAFVEEIPGVNTQGKTLAEAKKNLKEALAMVLQADRGLAHRSRGERTLAEPRAKKLALLRTSVQDLRRQARESGAYRLGRAEIEREIRAARRKRRA